MELTEARGTLVAIGGAEDRKGEMRILKEFVRLAGGKRARIAVMTAATEEPKDAAKEWRAIFKKLEVADVKILDVSERSDSIKEESIEKIEQATGIFFTGGDQLFITSLMGGTPLQKAIHKAYETGTVVGGTSAGAAMMSNSMIISGRSDENPRQGAVETGAGTDLIIGCIIDTHFSQRGRHGRLLTAVAHYPQDIGFGIDEDTAMIIKKDVCEVMGNGSVTVIDAGAMTYTNLPYVKEKESISLADVRIHVLTEGHKYHLKERRFIPPEEPKTRAKASGKNEEK